MSTQTRATGHITLRLIEDGSTVTTRFKVTQSGSAASLFQIYNTESGAVVPEWTSSAPLQITVEAARTGGTTTTAPTLSGHAWYYNNVLIANLDAATKAKFDTASASTATLKIIGNLADSSNRGNDIITYKGTATLGTNHTVKVEHSATVEITETGEGVYLGVITPAETFLSDAEPTATFTAKLYLGSTEVTDIAVCWTLAGKALNAEPAVTSAGAWTYGAQAANTALSSDFRSGYGTVTESSTAHTVKVGRANVDGQALLLCSFYIKQGTAFRVVERASAIVTDISDDVHIVLKSSTGPGVPAGATATVTGKLRKGEADFSPTGAAWTIKVLRSDTLAQVKTASASSVTVSATELSNAGGQVEVNATCTW